MQEKLCLIFGAPSTKFNKFSRQTNLILHPYSLKSPNQYQPQQPFHPINNSKIKTNQRLTILQIYHLLKRLSLLQDFSTFQSLSSPDPKKKHHYFFNSPKLPPFLCIHCRRLQHRPQTTQNKSTRTTPNRTDINFKESHRNSEFNRYKLAYREKLQWLLIPRNLIESQAAASHRNPEKIKKHFQTYIQGAVCQMTILPTVIRPFVIRSLKNVTGNQEP